MRTPIIFPIHSGGGHLPPEAALSLLIVLNFFLLIWLVIRYFLVRKRVNSFIVALFFDEDYGKYDFMDNFVNVPTMCLMLINGMAIVIGAAIWLMKYL